jgi:hypothetical protein
VLKAIFGYAFPVPVIGSGSRPERARIGAASTCAGAKSLQIELMVALAF